MVTRNEIIGALLEIKKAALESGTQKKTTEF